MKRLVLPRAATDPRAAARAVQLHYVSDAQPGITRRRTRQGFVYHDAAGRRVRDAASLRRIRSLAVPPAYEAVWICPDPRGHLQATGRDARGRKQYRYHPQWRQVRDATKYDRMLAFGRALPRLRARVDAALRRRELSRERVLAVILRLLDATHIRVGNEEYARANHSYGLTTMRTRHVELRGQNVRFCFRGKSGVRHDVTLTDRRVARALQRCLELPGLELFQYLGEDGRSHAVGSADVNAYLRELGGADFTAKDFRTWAGSVLALAALRALGAAAPAVKRHVVATVKRVAAHLNNTPAVCRRCYIHPRIVERYLDGGLASVRTAPPRRYLSGEEATLLRFLAAEAGHRAQGTGNRARPEPHRLRRVP